MLVSGRVHVFRISFTKQGFLNITTPFSLKDFLETSTIKRLPQEKQSKKILGFHDVCILLKCHEVNLVNLPFPGERAQRTRRLSVVNSQVK